MKTWLLLSIVFLALLPQAHADASAEAHQEFLREAIAELNQSAIEGLKVNQDLFKVYKSEIDAIEKKWRESVDSSKMSQKEKNRSKNNFYLAEISKKNKEITQTLAKPAAVEIDNLKTIALSVFNKVVEFNKSISEETRKRQQQEIGYCFSRAFLVHYLLQKNKVPRHQIKKIFAIGPIFLPPTLWRFHVATFVDLGSKQIVIDPLQKKPLTMEEWQAEVLKLSAETPFPRLRFYITDPRKFLPNSGPYDLSVLTHPYIKKHSKEMARFLQKESQLK